MKWNVNRFTCATLLIQLFHFTVDDNKTQRRCFTLEIKVKCNYLTTWCVQFIWEKKWDWARNRFLKTTDEPARRWFQEIFVIYFLFLFFTPRNKTSDHLFTCTECNQRIVLRFAACYFYISVILLIISFSFFRYLFLKGLLRKAFKLLNIFYIKVSIMIHNFEQQKKI